jgi:cell division protein FtsI/penicillin-binding protein 2
MTDPRTILVLALHAAVNSGGLLNVSSLERNGLGSKRVNRDKHSVTLKMVQEFPVVSDNYVTYRLAMELMGPEYEVYAQLYKERYGMGPGMRTTLTPKAAGMIRVRRLAAVYGEQEAYRIAHKNDMWILLRRLDLQNEDQ